MFFHSSRHDTWPLALASVWVAIPMAGILPRAQAQPASSTSIQTFQQHCRPRELVGGNVLLITLDTVRSDHLGCYGYSRAATPRIDALASQGALFSQAITPVPSTLPAHSTMLTGLEPPNHGVRTNGHFLLKPEITTLGEILQPRGYATSAYVGTYVLNKRFGISQGFDHYDDTLPGRDTGRRVARRANHITDAAIDWLGGHLKTNPEQPWFMWTHYFDAHKPYDPPGEYAERFADAPYDGEIAFTDEHVGRLLDFLSERGQIDRTLIVLTADHGEGLGDHGERDHSRLIYDSTMHVPLIISTPRLRAAPCRVSDVVVGLIDLTPTMLSIIGVDPPADLDGSDLTTAQLSPERSIYIETLSPLVYHGWASLHGLRRRDAKFILAPTLEYYDVARDPGELVNLIASQPEIHRQLATELQAVMGRWPSPDEAMNAVQGLTQKAAAKLAALGYVGTTRKTLPPPNERPDPKDIYPLYYDLIRKSPRALHDWALEMALPSDADAQQYRQAVHLAMAALAKRPNDGRFKATAGITLYRSGEINRANTVLRKSETLLKSEAEPLPVDMLVFSAMARHRLGLVAPAQRDLQRAQEASAANPDPAWPALLTEAETLLSKP